MITERDLQEAIAECQGERNPNANTCIKLAAFLTIRDHLYPDAKEPDLPTYSYAPPPDATETTVEYESGTEFGRAVHGRDPREIWPIIDELVSEPVRALNPRLYAAFMRKIRQ